MRRASVKGDDRGGVRRHDGKDGRVAAVEVEEVWRMVGGETAEASGLAFAEGDRIGEDGFGRDGDGRGGRTERRGDRELERAGGAADAVRAGDRDDGAGAAVGDAAGDDGPGDFGGEVPVARLEVLRLRAVRAAVPDLAAVNALAPGERVFDPEGEVRAAATAKTSPGTGGVTPPQDSATVRWSHSGRTTSGLLAARAASGSESRRMLRHLLISFSVRNTWKGYNPTLDPRIDLH